jgi:hypothetical protein
VKASNKRLIAVLSMLVEVRREVDGPLLEALATPAAAHAKRV